MIQKAGYCSRCGIDHIISLEENMVKQFSELLPNGVTDRFQGPAIPMRISMQGTLECGCSCDFADTRTHQEWCTEVQCAKRAMKDPTSSYWVTMDQG